MSMPMSFLRGLVLILFLAASTTTAAAQRNATVSCPLDFNFLQLLIPQFKTPSDLPSQCQNVKKGLRLVDSQYLKRTGNFLPPLNASESCWRVYQTLVDRVAPNFDVRSRCGFQTDWISEGCMNISTISQFERLIPQSTLDDVVSNCNQSLENSAPCAACTTSLSRLQASHLTGPSVGNLSDCLAYPFIYAAAAANQFGPTDRGTAKCLFSFEFAESSKKSKKKNKGLIAGVLVVCVVGFTFDDIKKATRNFSRDNIIGRGGYGNVYKGLLPDGSEVALKRFKNCSAAGDATFKHEVEVIASVRHVNLVALRGYCIATTQLEGHQRIIVCDLMKNGSVYDHLFASNGPKLSWPLRQSIALGTARGLAYLHFGAQPAIFHRDIKASNILLDEKFEAKVGDFGLAKFTPEGFTHLSTRVAGTMGYLAPEYALYGQLTDKEFFGVVLLELLSGRKALIMNDDGQASLVTDWAWSLVKEGRALDVIEDGMPEMGVPEGSREVCNDCRCLCSHPQLYARPTMDQVVKMLETEQCCSHNPRTTNFLLSEPMLLPTLLSKSVASCT
ncbi:hypothetical protein CUMW_054630 [Citrus unshiu]|nr:hypothetical protein CUMW_054630 [Citrus unshiu]